MGVYVYAAVDGNPARLGRGAWRERLECVRCGQLSLVVGVRRGAPRLSPGGLKAHWAVLRRLDRRSDAVLPFRFATYLASGQALSKALRGQTRSLRSALEKVRGSVQMTVRFRTRPTPPARPRPRTGRAYLSSRQEALRLAQSAPELAPTRRALASLVRDEGVERSTDGKAVTVFHLVPRESVAAYLRVWRGVRLPRARNLRVTGPFPPFAFGPARGTGASR